MKKKVEKDQLLQEVLEAMFPESSGRTLKNWLKGKRISVDGNVVTIGKHLVKEGQEVAIGKINKIEEFGVLYEDPHLVIIDKPAGLLSVPLDYGDAKSAFSILREHYQNTPIYPVHRIDRETSGVLVFAKSEAAQFHLDDLFMRHDLTREYAALVEGHVASQKGTWKSYLKELSSYEVISTENEHEGSLAITHYEVVKRTAKSTFLRLILETGKKHQIRVHCKDAGHPVVGDRKYGSTLLRGGLCLFARRIAFIHPITKKPIDVVSKQKNLFSFIN